MPIFRDNPTLLVRYRGGDPDALEEVYRYYVRRVDGHFRSLARSAGAPELGQPSAVADLLQETFTRALSAKARAAYDGRDFAPYINAIARNCFCDMLRKRRIEVSIPPDELPVVEDATQAQEELEPEMLTMLQVYVHGLSSELRGVYERRFVQGLSQEAACKVLGITRRSLRTSESHLRHGFRKCLSLARLARYPSLPSLQEARHAKA